MKDYQRYMLQSSFFWVLCILTANRILKTSVDCGRNIPTNRRIAQGTSSTTTWSTILIHHMKVAHVNHSCKLYDTMDTLSSYTTNTATSIAIKTNAKRNNNDHAIYEELRDRQRINELDFLLFILSSSSSSSPPAQSN